MKKTILASVWYDEQFELEVNVNATEEEIEDLIVKEMDSRQDIEWDFAYDDFNEE